MRISEHRREETLAPTRCGIILAAGEGVRLRPLVTRLIGEPLPKQYVSFVGTRSMLEHTLHRAQKLIPDERVFTVISESHLERSTVLRQLARRPQGTVILQPQNRDTAAGLLLPLTHVHRRFPEAVVAVFPSDHFVLKEDLFMAHVDVACTLVEEDPNRVILLGVEPCGAEPDYGYILPADEADPVALHGARRVARFIEKPRPPLAEELARRGGLWNTLVMVFRAGTLLELTRELLPELARAFEPIEEAIGAPEEAEVVSDVYSHLPPLNLSRDLLERLPALRSPSLTVLPVRGVQWSDWGSEDRVLNTLRTGLPSTRREAPAGASARI